MYVRVNINSLNYTLEIESIFFCSFPLNLSHSLAFTRAGQEKWHAGADGGGDGEVLKKTSFKML